MGNTVELVITAKGHPNIRAMHKSTWQLTVEEEITPRGDCIIGVRSSHSCATLPGWFKSALQDGSRVSVTIEVNGDLFHGEFTGDPGLQLTDEKDIVIRRSYFLSERTGGVGCSFSAGDLPKEMRMALTDAETTIVTRFKVIA